MRHLENLAVDADRFSAEYAYRTSVYSKTREVIDVALSEDPGAKINEYRRYGYIQ